MSGDCSITTSVVRSQRVEQEKPVRSWDGMQHSWYTPGWLAAKGSANGSSGGRSISDATGLEYRANAFTVKQFSSFSELAMCLDGGPLQTLQGAPQGNGLDVLRLSVWRVEPRNAQPKRACEIVLTKAYAPELPTELMLHSTQVSFCEVMGDIAVYSRRRRGASLRPLPKDTGRGKEPSGRMTWATEDAA